MKFLEDIKRDTIVICSNSNKKVLLKKMNSFNKLISVKFMTKEEFYSLYYFSYDERAIYYLMNKFNIKYDIAIMYLRYLIYVCEEYDNSKLNKLMVIKKELDDNGLLIYDKFFKSYIKNRDIIIYGYSIDKSLSKIINENNNISVFNKDNNKYKHSVYSFSHINDEIVFVAEKICELLNKSIDINRIKIVNVDEEYSLVIKRVFDLYNIPIDLNDSAFLYYTLPGSYLLNNYSSDLSIVVEEMKEKFDVNIINQIINVINKYTFVSDKLLVKDMIVNDLKSVRVNSGCLVNKVECINLDDIDEEDYVFILGFNQGSIPKIYKDEGYLSNKELDIIGLENSFEKNEFAKNEVIRILESYENLFISYKEKSYSRTFYPSSLVSELDMEVIETSYSYKYSNKYNKVLLCKMLDEYYKYNTKSDDLDKLYNTYELDYKSYDNRFSGIDFDSFNKMVNNRVNLSYSSMQKYNECAFKYYIANVLKLDEYIDSFSAFIGVLFHHILEIGITKTIDVREEVDRFISDKSFNEKEKFYIDKLISDMEFAISVIKDRMKFSKFDNEIHENEINVIKNGNISVNFSGFIDKMMSVMNNGKMIIALVDYKTYDTDVKMDLIDYGLNIQLPIYLYLAKNKYPNVSFAGFYVQKILPSDNKYDENKSIVSRKSESMKLCGYSNSDEEILELFDSSYRDSNVIKGLKFNKDGFFSSSANVLSDEEMNEIYNKVDMEIDKCVQNIENCNFDINPKSYKGVNISCKYCKYSDICFKSFKDTVNIKEEDNA